jgi:Na+/pantothenate symporter
LARGAGNSRRQFYLIILFVAARLARQQAAVDERVARDRTHAATSAFCCGADIVTAIIVEQHSAGNLGRSAFPWRTKMTDRYTKVVLTVIAVALAVIAARDWLPVKPATAQNGPVRVIIDSVEPYAFQRTTVPVKVANYW